MTREDYQRHYSGGYARTGQPVIVPENVERVAYHEPCTFCGTARGCKHRRLAA